MELEREREKERNESAKSETGVVGVEARQGKRGRLTVWGNGSAAFDSSTLG